MKKKPILLYHANCPDGFGAAWAFHKKYEDRIDYLSICHNNELPFHGLDQEIFRDRIVWVADIAFSRQDSEYISSITKEFQIIDHHLSAQETLKDLPYVKIDLSHSGSVLSWIWCHSNTPPLLLSYIEDRDIGNWNLPYSAEVLAYIDSFDRDFPSWYNLEHEIATALPSVIREGAAILRYTNQLKNNLTKQSYLSTIAGYQVPIINIPFLKSEILNDLAKDYPFAAGYHFNGKSYIFSLRSREEGINVAEVAQKFGGGGHFHAAGFSIQSLEKIS